MTWMHRDPVKAPPSAPPVDVAKMLAAISEQERAGAATPAASYLRLMVPKPQVDKWGQPLPLNDVDQDKADRLFAVLVAPLERMQRLLHSGLLIADEVDAVKTAFPEVYTLVVQQALRDLMDGAPPFREWAESVVGVLFGMPPAQLLQSTNSPEKQMAQHEAKQKPDTTPEMSGTAADRREISVRKELR